MDLVLVAFEIVTSAFLTNEPVSSSRLILLKKSRLRVRYTVGYWPPSMMPSTTSFGSWVSGVKSMGLSQEYIIVIKMIENIFRIAV